MLSAAVSCGDDDESSRSRRSSKSSSSDEETTKSFRSKSDDDEDDKEEDKDGDDEDAAQYKTTDPNATSSGDAVDIGDIDTLPDVTLATTAQVTQTQTTTAFTSPTVDSDIVGRWKMDGIEDSGVDSGGIQFDADGTGSIYENITSIMHFESGGLYVGGITLDSSYFSYDGTAFDLTIEGESLLKMERVGAPSPDSYDGTYTLSSGSLLDSIISAVSDSDEIDSNNLNIEMTFENSTCIVLFKDMFTFTAAKAAGGDNGIFKAEGKTLLFDQDNSTAIYTISGDTLTIGEGSTQAKFQRDR